MEYPNVAADTCPLCGEHALRLEGKTCTCQSCGSEFVLDPETRRCHYTRVAPQYGFIAPALTQDWMTRAEVFERVRQSYAETPPESAAPIPFSDIHEVTPTDATKHPSPATEARARGNATGASPRPATPVMTVWVILIGALALIPILCACLSALLLGRDIPRTRAIIAAANAPTLTAPVTTIVQVTATSAETVPISPLISPLMTPTVVIQETTIAELFTGTVGPGTIEPATTLMVATAVNNVTPAPATASFFTPPPPTPFTAKPTSAPLPPTFTPLAVALPTLTAQPSPIAATVTPTPALERVLTPTVTGIVSGTPTATPTPTYGPSISSSVVISGLMYAGNASVNWSDQYVEVQNRGSVAVNISNWRIKAVTSGHSFTFYTGLVLQPGETCRIYGNSAPLSTGGCGPFSFSSPTQVWSTSSDTAQLFDASNALVNIYTYSAH